MKPKSHWTPRNWLAFPLLLVSLAWVFAFADDPKPTDQLADPQPAETTPVEKQEPVTDKPTSDKNEEEKTSANPKDSNTNNLPPGADNNGAPGFIGGGYGGGVGGIGGGVVSGTPNNYLTNQTITFTWNKEKTIYWGYSNLLGTWASVRLPENSGPATPLLNSYIGCLQLKDRIYSFSSKLGKWTSVDIPKDSGKVLPIVSSNVAFFRLKDRVYGFSAAVGRWEELKVNDPADPALLPDSIVVTDGDKIHIFSEKTGRWTSPGEDDVKLMGIQLNNFPSATLQISPPEARTATSSTSAAPVTIPGPAVLYQTQSGLTQQQAHVLATAVLTQPQNLWRRRADLYQASARELLLALQGLDRQNPDIVETQERMKKEYDELLNLTVDAQLNAQKEDAQLLKARFERIEAQIAENEKNKEETIKKLDQQLQTVTTPRRPMFDENNDSSTFERRVDPPSSSTGRPTEFIP